MGRWNGRCGKFLYFPHFPDLCRVPAHSSPSLKKDEGLHVERFFAPYPRSIQLLFSVYFYAVYLHEPQANTSPSSSSQSGRFIGKSNQVSRGKSFLNVSAKQRAQLNWLDYKKGRESHLLFPPCSSWTALSSPHSTPPSSKPKRASMTQDSHVIPRHPPPAPPPPSNRVTNHLKHSKFSPAARPRAGISVTSLLEIKGSNREAERGTLRSGDDAPLIRPRTEGTLS